MILRASGSRLPDERGLLGLPSGWRWTSTAVRNFRRGIEAGSSRAIFLELGESFLAVDLGEAVLLRTSLNLRCLPQRITNLFFGVSCAASSSNEDICISSGFSALLAFLIWSKSWAYLFVLRPQGGDCVGLVCSAWLSVVTLPPVIGEEPAYPVWFGFISAYQLLWPSRGVHRRSVSSNPATAGTPGPP